MNEEPRGSGGSRLLTFAAWTVLVLGLWLWGREITGVPVPPAGRAGGAGAAVPGLPTAHSPLAAAPCGAARRTVPGHPGAGDLPRPRPRGGDRAAPYENPGTVGWWSGGTQPGRAGTALLVGHVDTRTKPAVFYGLSTAQPGEKVGVVRADGSVAEFTIEEVRVYERAGFDPQKAYGPKVAGRAELRLVTCGGTYDKKAKEYSANVVVAAYLTGVKAGPGTAV